MNKQPRIIDFQNTRNAFFQNSRTFFERINTQTLTLYHSTNGTSINNEVIDLKVPITIDAMSEVRLESIQVTTMDPTTNISNTNGAYIKINTIGFIIDIEEFNIKSGSNIDDIRDKFFIPYTSYNYTSEEGLDFSSDTNMGHGLNHYANSGPLKNNYVCTVNPKKLSTITLTVKRLEAANIYDTSSGEGTNGGTVFSKNLDTNYSSKSGPTGKDIFDNGDYLGDDGNNNGGDIMLVFSITNLGNTFINNDATQSAFMNPQDDLMNLPNEYERLLLQNQQRNQMNQPFNNQQQVNQMVNERNRQFYSPSSDQTSRSNGDRNY